MNLKVKCSMRNENKFARKLAFLYVGESLNMPIKRIFYVFGRGGRVSRVVVEAVDMGDEGISYQCLSSSIEKVFSTQKSLRNC
jgi:hypothetical protein